MYDVFVGPVEAVHNGENQLRPKLTVVVKLQEIVVKDIRAVAVAGV